MHRRECRIVQRLHEGLWCALRQEDGVPCVGDFTPVILIAEVPLVLITRKDLPVNNFKEFVAYAKEHQAQLQFGSAGGRIHLASIR
jgi:tripartite-type tricarboxylate transporter receptor subunit TctC